MCTLKTNHKLLIPQLIFMRAIESKDVLLIQNRAKNYSYPCKVIPSSALVIVLHVCNHKQPQAALLFWFSCRPQTWNAMTLCPCYLFNLTLLNQHVVGLLDGDYTCTCTCARCWSFALLLYGQFLKIFTSLKIFFDLDAK